MKTRFPQWASRIVVAAVTFSACTISIPAADSPPATESPRSATSERALGKVERADRLIGKEVRNANEQIGKIDDLVVDLASGRVLFALMSAGSFLGVGDRLVAIPPTAFQEQGGSLRLDTDKSKLSAAPELPKEEDQAFSPAFAAHVYKHFGQTWTGGSSGKAFENVHRAGKLIGHNVKNVSNETIGEVNNLAIDLAAARVVAVILAPSRTLGLDSDTLYALPPMALTLSSDDKSLTTAIDKARFGSAPSFKKDNWPEMNSAWATRIYQFYGKQAYFETGEQLRPTGRTNTLEKIYHEPGETNQNQ